MHYIENTEYTLYLHNKIIKTSIIKKHHVPDFCACYSGTDVMQSTQNPSAACNKQMH